MRWRKNGRWRRREMGEEEEDGLGRRRNMREDDKEELKE